MKVIYFLKNFKVNRLVSDFIKLKVKRLNRFFRKDKKQGEGIIEIGLSKNKEVKKHPGLYKAKIILNLPKKSLLIITSTGKNIFQVLNSAFKKIILKLKKQ